MKVLNAGVPGYTSFDSLGNLWGNLWMLQPDYILIYNAWNDIKYFKGLSPEHPLIECRLRSAHIDDPRLNYNGVLDQVLGVSEFYSWIRLRYYTWKLRVGEEGLIPEGDYSNEFSEWAIKQYKLNLLLFVDTCHNIGAIPILMTQATLLSDSISPEERKRIGYNNQKLTHNALLKAVEECNRTVRLVSYQKKTKLIDIDSTLSGNGSLFSDHVHLSEDGGRTIAKIVSEFLIDELTSQALKRNQEEN